MPVTIDDETNLRAWNTTLKLGPDHGLSAYDAAYWELAMRRGLRLASLDRELEVAARAVGVTLFGSD